MDEPASARDETRVAASDAQAEPRIVDVRELMGAAREIVIAHGGELYRLRITARDRLILTK